MPHELIEAAVNLAEPIMLFLLLKHKLPVRKKTLPIAILCIAVLAAATTVMNKIELDFVLTIIIYLILYCIYAALFFIDDIRLRLVWASMMVYIVVFANTLLMAVLYAISDASFMAVMEPTVLRVVIQVIYIPLCLLMVMAVIKATKNITTVSSKAAVGALFSCLISIAAMYLILEATIASASAGVSSVKYGIISILLMALAILLLVLFGKASVWAQKYSEECIVSESLKREIQYNSEMLSISQTVRQLKHDYSNHMSVIASLTADGDMKALRKYMDDYRSEYGIVDRYAITGDNTLDSLLCYKSMICDAEGIDLIITAFGESIQKTGLSAVELSSLFGNLIDNSIKACKMLEPERRKIILSIRKMADMFSIRIENERMEDTCVNENEEHHGLGLPRIMGIVESHNGVCTIKPEKNRFIVEILLPKECVEADKDEA